MSFIEIAKSRYTTKLYDANGKISDEDIEKLKEIIRLSPSSINSQPWKFTFVGEGKMKRKLADLAFWNKDKINAASHLVVFSVIDDIALFKAQISEHLGEGAIKYFEEFLEPKGEAEIKAWMRHQVYLSLGFFLSACASMGIDSTPMEGIENDKYDEVLGYEGYKSLFAVSIGYRSPEDKNQPSNNPKFRLPKEEVVQAI